MELYQQFKYQQHKQTYQAHSQKKPKLKKQFTQSKSTSALKKPFIKVASQVTIFDTKMGQVEEQAQSKNPYPTPKFGQEFSLQHDLFLTSPYNVFSAEESSINYDSGRQRSQGTNGLQYSDRFSIQSLIKPLESHRNGRRSRAIRATEEEKSPSIGHLSQPELHSNGGPRQRRSKYDRSRQKESSPVARSSNNRQRRTKYQREQYQKSISPHRSPTQTKQATEKATEQTNEAVAHQKVLQASPLGQAHAQNDDRAAHQPQRRSRAQRFFERKKHC